MEPKLWGSPSIFGEVSAQCLVKPLPRARSGATSVPLHIDQNWSQKGCMVRPTNLSSPREATITEVATNGTVAWSRVEGTGSQSGGHPPGHSHPTSRPTESAPTTGCHTECSQAEGHPPGDPHSTSRPTKSAPTAGCPTQYPQAAGFQA